MSLRSRLRFSLALCSRSPLARRAVALAVALPTCALTLASCDSEPDPVGRSDSPFSKQGDGERAVRGRAYAGDDVVPGIAVRMEAVPAYADDIALARTNDPSWTATTTPTGAFEFINAPFRYDLFFTRGAEAIAFKGLGYRFVEPHLGESGEPRAFHARLQTTTTPAPPAGHALVWFVSNGEAVGVSADPSRGAVDVAFRTYSAALTLRAVEVDAAAGPSGLLAPFASGALALEASNGVAARADLTLAPVAPSPRTITFDVAAPPGFAGATVDVSMDFGIRTDARLLTTVPAGGSITLTPAPDARYLVRARATRADGATSESKLVAIDPAQPRVALELPDAPVRVEPIDDLAVGSGKVVVEAPLTASGSVFARGASVVEHVLVPVSGAGMSYRVVAAPGAVALPDHARAGLPGPSGRYTWTVRGWDLDYPEQLVGRDARAVNASAVAPSRVIVFP